MSSPFTFIRRNMHVMMVGIVILSMMAFTLDTVFAQRDSQFVMLGLMLGGIIFAFAGIGRGRWIQYGIGGAVLGAVCGWVLPGVISPSNVYVRTSTIGAFDNKRISELMNRRTIANVFMQQAFEKSIGPGMGQFAPQFRFYTNSDEDDLTFGELMRTEADKLGIVVTDAMVSDYINSRTDEKLSAAAFAEVRSTLNFGGSPVSAEELFDAFRDEIKAQMAFQQLSPQMASVPQGPEVYYAMFQRTKVSQRLNTARLDVDAFVSEVADPSEAEVVSLFEERRRKIPGIDEPGSVGFFQDNKAKLAYIELGYKKVEESVTPPTEPEIEAHYNENKDLRYRKPSTPIPTTPTAPDSATSSAPDAPAASAPAGNAPATDTPVPDPPVPDPPAPDAPALDAPALDAPAASAPAGNAPAPGAPAGNAPSPDEPATEPPATEPPATEPPATEPPSDECLPFSEDETPPAADTPTTATPVTEPAQTPPSTETPVSLEAQSPAVDAAKPVVQEPLTIPQSSTDLPAVESGKPEFEIPKVEYVPLDEELKSSIRDSLLNDKVSKALDERMKAVMDDLKAFEKDRSNARRAAVDEDRSISPEDLHEKMRPFTKTMIDGMKSVAEKHGCSFVETRLLSYPELVDVETWPIGSATEASPNQFMQSGPTVAQQVFTAFPNDVTDDTNLFDRKSAVKNAFDPDGGEAHFAWWIVEFSAAHVPEPGDPGIREQVVVAYKRMKARDLVMKRAEELATIVRDGLAKPEADRKGMSASLEDQTLLGTPESAPLAVRQTKTFSWMEQSMTPQMNFMQRPTLRRSAVAFADERGGTVRFGGDRFMKGVFEDLQNDEVGVVANDDLSSYYLVQAVERTADDEILRQQFLTEGKQFGFKDGPVATILNTTVASKASIAWEESIWTRYGIDRTLLREE